MRGDFSRIIPARAGASSLVHFQQGAPIVDADLNRVLGVLQEQFRGLATDIIGWHGWPGAPGNDHAFEVQDVTDDQIILGPGRYYINGLACDNASATEVEVNDVGPVNRLLLLEAWEREVNHLDLVGNGDAPPIPRLPIQDPAFGEVATTLHSMTVWRIRAVALAADNTNPEDEILSEAGIWELVDGAGPAVELALTIDNPDPGGDDGRCLLPPDADYLGLEHRLYRLETRLIDGDELELVWSDDNGSTIYGVVPGTAVVGGARVELTTMVDDRTRLCPGDLVEVCSDGLSAGGTAGFLHEIVEVDPVGRRVTLSEAAVGTAGSPPGSAPAYLRRWSGLATADLGSPAAGVPLVRHRDGQRELGLVVQTRAVAVGESGPTAPGDYWTYPARSGLPWPADHGQWRSADGIRRHRAPLAVVVAGTAQDRRRRFVPLTLAESGGNGDDGLDVPVD